MNRFEFATQTCAMAPAPGSGSRIASVLPRPPLSPDLNRMLSAAAVSVGFRQQLLADPVAALAAGYGGERFNILPDELAQILAIRAGTLAEFAAELLERLWHHRLDEERKARRETPPSGAGLALPAREEAGRSRTASTNARRCKSRSS